MIAQIDGHLRSTNNEGNLTVVVPDQSLLRIRSKLITMEGNNLITQ